MGISVSAQVEDTIMKQGYLEREFTPDDFEEIAIKVKRTDNRFAIMQDLAPVRKQNPNLFHELIEKVYGGVGSPEYCASAFMLLWNEMYHSPLRNYNTNSNSSNDNSISPSNRNGFGKEWIVKTLQLAINAIEALIPMTRLSLDILVSCIHALFHLLTPQHLGSVDGKIAQMAVVLFESWKQKLEVKI